MQLVTNGDYIERQRAFVEAMLLAVRSELLNVEAPPELIEQLTGSIGFAVASLIDGTSPSVYERSGEPMLAFAVGQDQLLWAGGNSWLHEYVYRVLPTLPAA